MRIIKDTPQNIFRNSRHLFIGRQVWFGLTICTRSSGFYIYTYIVIFTISYVVCVCGLIVGSGLPE